MGKWIFLFLACSLASLVQAKTFTRCGLANELLKHGIPKNELANWVCLVEAESSRNTHATHKNGNGSTDYGLFQINNRYWCSEGSAGKDCNITCKALLSDDISAAVKCAQLVKRRKGWTAWNGWSAKCKGTLPDISHC